jgi:hypothetical protein
MKRAFITGIMVQDRFAQLKWGGAVSVDGASFELGWAEEVEHRVSAALSPTTPTTPNSSMRT